MPKTLLLADDSVVIQKLVGLSFANEDVELVTTDNGDDALTRARQLKPDLVLADVVMPGKNGYEVCQAIKTDAELATTPVLLLTGTFEAFDEDRAREVGSDGHITKPFEAQGLVDRVTELLAQPRPAAAAPTPAPQQAAPAAPAQAAPVTPEPAAVAPAPAAAAPEPVVAAPAAAPEADDAYDFFDDDVQELAAPEAPAAAPAAPASPMTDDSFEFAADLDELESASPGTDPDTLDTNFDLDPEPPGDLTVAVPAPAVPVDARAPDATRVDMGETMIAEDLGMPEAAKVASLDESLARPQAFPAPPAAPAAAPPPVPDPGETMIADDLFADPMPAAPKPPPVPAAPATPPPAPPAPATRATAEPPMPPAMDSGFEFGSDEPAVAAEPVAAAPKPAPAAALSDVGEDITAPAPAEVEPASAVDDDPLADMAAPSLDESPDLEPASWATPVADGPALDEVAESTQSGYDVSVSDLGAPPESPSVPPAAALREEAPALASRPSPAPEPVSLASEARSSSAPEISPMMRDQIHETLEKVAWEAFADVSDTIVKQVLQRVESIVWEVVPQMAEALIQEEIRRMKGED